MNILYCVAGEGRGHAFRTIPIIEHLRKKHEVVLFAGDVSFPLLKKFKPQKISSLRIIYFNNRVSNICSLFINLLKLPWHIASIFRIGMHIVRHKPDILINDFETFSSYLARIFGVPIITVDNHGAILTAKYDVPKRFWLNAAKVWLVVKLLSPFANARVVPTFFQLPCKNAILVPPVVREDVLALKPKIKKHILVYQTSKSNKKLIPAMLAQNAEFVVYGFGDRPKLENITFVGWDQNRFLKDFASCNAVITNGGFTLITEALALKKPILSLPIIGQFEQVLNGYYLQKLGLGMCSYETNAEVIREFIEKKETIRKQLQKLPTHSNKQFLHALDDAITKSTRKV